MGPGPGPTLRRGFKYNLRAFHQSSVLGLVPNVLTADHTFNSLNIWADDDNAGPRYDLKNTNMFGAGDLKSFQAARDCDNINNLQTRRKEILPLKAVE